MKKSLRVLALILAVITVMSSMSAMASAYSGYKGSYLSASNYDDANDLVLTTGQYASMAMDELDRMLAEEFSEPIDLLGMAELKLYSVDETIISVCSLIDQLGSALDLLGDASMLKKPLQKLGTTSYDSNSGTYALANGRGISRSMKPTDNGFAYWSDTEEKYDWTTGETGTESDLLALYAVLDLLGALGPVVEKYAAQTLKLGILSSMVEAYMFDVRKLAFSALIKVAKLGDEYDESGNRTKKWDVMDDMNNIASIPNGHGAKYLEVGTETNGYQAGALLLANDVLKKFILGDWVQLGTTGYEWYSSTNKTSKIVYDEYYWKEYVLNSSTGMYELKPIADPGALDMNTYEYWGYVHPDAWVTFGLGDAVRIKKTDLETLKEQFRTESYTAVDLAASKLAIKQGEITGYDFIENLIVQAYNGIAVPVLNRKTVKWLREEAGYKMLDSKENEYLKDSNGDYLKDANGEKVKNPDFDYCYMGEDYKDELYDDDSKLYSIFNVGNAKDGYIKLEKYDVTGKTGTFIDNLHSTLKAFVKQLLIVDENVAFSFTDDYGNPKTATWEWVDGNNNTFVNACSLVRFVLAVTGNEFFDKYAIDRGEIKNCNELYAMSDMELVTYLLRVILNSSIDWFYLPDIAGDTLVDVGYALVEQMAYQDIPQFTFTKPTAVGGVKDDAYNRKVLDEALLILANIGVYNLNQDLDTDQYINMSKQTAITPSIDNDGETNNTGLLSYVTDATPLKSGYSTRYGMILAQIGTWAITKYGAILNMKFVSDNDGYNYTNRTEADFWTDLDTIINNIIPIYNDTKRTYGKSLLTETISEGKVESSVLKEIIFQYFALPILSLDNTGKIFKLFERGTKTAFSGTQDFESIIVDILHLIFEDLFPGIFNDSTNSSTEVAMKDLDSIINNTGLGKFLSRLLSCLGAHTHFKDAKGDGIVGRGKAIAEVALPVVCSILGLDGAMEFGELENYIPDEITKSSSQQYLLYNSSTGINTSYLSGSTRNIDTLYTIKFSENPVVELVSGTAGSSAATINGIKKDDTLAGGATKGYTLSNLVEGNIYNVKFTYDVYDETGSGKLASGMVNSRYVYVGSSTSLEAKASLNGGELKYTTDYYLTGGIGGSDGWTFSFKNKTDGADIKVISTTLKDPSGNTCSWFGKKNYYTDAGNTIKNSKVWVDGLSNGGTYVLSPFEIAEGTNAVRQQYVYAKSNKAIDENANPKQYPDLVDPITGLKYIDHVMTTEEYKAANEDKDVVWLKNGTYTLTTTVQSGSATVTVNQYIHFYEEYGVEGLFNNAVEKNYTVSSTNGSEAAISYFNDTYSPALKKTAAFVLKAMGTGTAWVNTEGNLDSTIPETLVMDSATATANEITKTSYTFQNKYQQYYAYLRTAVNGLNEHLASQGASELYELLDTYIGMTRYEPKTINAKIFNKDGVTTSPVTFSNMNMPINVEYYESGYKFVGMRNYMAHTYNVFREARNLAMDLIDRDEAYHHLSFAITQEEYDAKWAEYNNTLTAYSETLAAYNTALNAYNEAESDKSTDEQTLSKLLENKNKLAKDANKLSNEANSCLSTIKSWNNSFVAYEAWTAKTISDMELKYAKHVLQRSYNRLISLVGKNSQANSKLTKIINTYDMKTADINATYTKTSAQNYINALTFAKSITSASEPEKINTATTKVIYYYKKLLKAADKKELKASIQTAYEKRDQKSRTVYSDHVDLDNLSKVKDYTTDSYQTYLLALKAAYDALNTDYVLAQQDEVDAIQDNLDAAISGLRTAGQSGGDDPAEGDYSYSFAADLEGEEGDLVVFTVNDNLYWSPCVDTIYDYDACYGFYDSESETPEVPEITYYEDEETGEAVSVPLTGYIFGLPIEATEETYTGLFASASNCRVIVVPVYSEAYEEYLYGSGTKIFVVADTEDEYPQVYESYIAILRGDPNGDGNIDSDDTYYIQLMLDGIIDPWNEEYDIFPRYISADVDATYEVDSDDVYGLRLYLDGIDAPDINGVVWTEIWQPSGNNIDNIGEYIYTSEEE